MNLEFSFNCNWYQNRALPILASFHSLQSHLSRHVGFPLWWNWSAQFIQSTFMVKGILSGTECCCCCEITESYLKSAQNLNCCPEILFSRRWIRLIASSSNNQFSLEYNQPLSSFHTHTHTRAPPHTHATRRTLFLSSLSRSYSSFLLIHFWVKNRKYTGKQYSLSSVCFATGIINHLIQHCSFRDTAGKTNIRYYICCKNSELSHQ